MMTNCEVVDGERKIYIISPSSTGSDQIASSKDKAGAFNKFFLSHSNRDEATAQLSDM